MSLPTLLSILGLALLGWALPFLLMRLMPDSLRGLLAALLIAVPLLTLVGAGLFALSYAGRLGSGGLGVLARPEAALHFWELGVRASLIWGPVLALTALGLAQGIERRRGERMARRERD